MSESEIKLHEANMQLLDQQYVWSTPKALIGLWKNTLGTREGIFFVIVAIAYFTLHSRKNEPIYWIMFCAVGITFIFFKALEILISERTTVNMNASIQKSIQESIQRMLEKKDEQDI